MNVVVLAGGEGRRLRPLTEDTPKPLLPVCGRPLLAYREDMLVQAGIMQAELIASAATVDTLRTFAECPDRVVTWTICEEETPLGEAGGLFRYAGKEILAIAGDLFGALPIKELQETQRRTKAAATVLLQADKTGTFAVTKEDMVKETRCPNGFSGYTYGGVVLLSAWATTRLVPGERLEMTAFLQRLIDEGATVSAVFGSAPFLDVNDAVAYRRAVRQVLRRKAPDERYYIGQNVTIGDGAVIGKSCAIEDGVRIERGACLHGCIVGAGAEILEGAHLRDSIVASRAVIGRHARLKGNSVIGRGALIADGVALTAGARVRAGKTVSLQPAPLPSWKWSDPQATPRDATLRELTSSGLAAVGAALGSEWQEATVLVCTEGQAAVLKGALAAGFSEVGCSVLDGGEAFLGKAAYLTAQCAAAWGIHLSDAGLHLLDGNGNDVPQSLWQAAEQRLATADIRQREPYEWTLPKSLSEHRSYHDWLCEHTAGIRPLSLDIRGDRASAACLWEVLQPLGCTEGEGLRLRLSDGGRRLAAYTPASGYIDAERLRALLTRIDREPSRADGLEAALCLLAYLCESGETLTTLNQRLPTAVHVCRTAVATPETKEALRRFAADELDSNGVRVVKPDGQIRVQPLSRGRMLSILAEAVSTEIAAELCDDMIARLCVIPLDN